MSEPLGPRELDELRVAKRLLETPNLAVRMSDALGRPIDATIEMLPERAVHGVQRAVRVSLERGLDFAVATLDPARERLASERLHRLAAATTGAMGGFFGLAGLMLELPVTTVIMLRSIGEIARSEGQDLRRLDTRLACVEVFALGGPSKADDAAETGYYAVRAGLATVIHDAVRHVAQRGFNRAGAPTLVRLLEKIAARFGLVVQEKVALELIPAIGAVGGAWINTVFTSHFQRVARGHFIVRRLEQAHGLEVVRHAYESL